MGRRDAFTANAVMLAVADRLATRVQLTMDGHKPYLDGLDIDEAPPAVPISN